MEIIKEIPYNENWKKRTETKNIILHHAEAERCTVQDIDNWHKKGNGWIGIGYHYFVRKNGKIYEGRPFDVVGAHTLNGYNNNSIGICFEGNFEVEKMDEPQRLAGIELIKYIQMRYNNSLRIFRHLDVQSSTLCPGKNFPNSIIYEGMQFDKQSHWAELPYQKLIDSGIIIHDKRFNDNITRGEVIALLAQFVKAGG